MKAEQIQEALEHFDEREVANVLLGTLEIALRAVDETTGTLRRIADDSGHTKPDQTDFMVIAQGISYAARRRLLEITEESE